MWLLYLTMSDRYVAIISYNYVEVISYKYMAAIYNKYMVAIYDERRTPKKIAWVEAFFKANGYCRY